MANSLLTNQVHFRFNKSGCYEILFIQYCYPINNNQVIDFNFCIQSTVDSRIFEPPLIRNSRLFEVRASVFPLDLLVTQKLPQLFELSVIRSEFLSPLELRITGSPLYLF